MGLVHPKKEIRSLMNWSDSDALKTDGILLAVPVFKASSTMMQLKISLRAGMSNDMHIPTYTPTFSLWYNLTMEGRWRKINTNKIATRIRALRQAHNLTQQELAALCHFPGPWKISRLEGGKKGSGIERIDTLEIVCQELGIELWELLKPDFVIPGEDEDEK